MQGADREEVKKPEQGKSTAIENRLVIAGLGQRKQFTTNVPMSSWGFTLILIWA
jgi:hypothetical protein